MTDQLITLRQQLESLRGDAEASAKYAQEDATRRKVIPEMIQSLRELVAGETGADTFRDEFDRRTRKEWFCFGFGGMSGAMFLNKLLKHLPKQHDAIGTQLRNVLALPKSEQAARESLSHFCNWIDARIAAGESTKADLRPASASFLVSAWWHVQSPELWPVYYPNSRDALQEVGAFESTQKTVDDYFAFRTAYLRVAKELSLDSWAAEHLFDYSRAKPDTDGDSGAKIVVEPKGQDDDSPPETSQHTLAQHLLIELGRRFQCQVWVPSADRGKKYNGKTLGDGCLAELPDLGLDDAAEKTIANIDVIWLSGQRRVVAAFEIESTTAIFSGLLRMSDLVVSTPNLNIPLYIVAPNDRVEKVRAQLRRPTFRQLEVHKHCRYFSIETLSENFDGMYKFAQSHAALNAIAKSVD